MRIVILGAGQVGGTLAKNLASEDNDITLIDLDANRLRNLQSRLDIQTVQGSAAYPKVLIDAGIEQADMLIAVTNSDEVNMMGCQIAYSLFRTPSKIARIRSSQYYEYKSLFTNDHIPVDDLISPERLVTRHIENLIQYPGVSQAHEFANGKVLIITIKIDDDDIMCGNSIAELHNTISSLPARLIAILRNKQPLTLDNEASIETQDELIFSASSDGVHNLLITLGRYTHPNRRIMIAGGGHIGKRLALALEAKYRIKIIERNQSKCQDLASTLHKATILQGDIADRELLLNENIEFIDVFCAVTNDDEANIMSCLQAKKLGTRHVMALVNRSAYVELIEDSSIDHALSPQFITIGSILAKLRRGDMVKVIRLGSTKAEALEVIAHGDESTSKVVGKALGELELPASIQLAAIVRGNQVILPDEQEIIQSEDHIVMLVLKKRVIKQVEALFQVSLGFFQ